MAFQRGRLSACPARRQETKLEAFLLS